VVVSAGVGVARGETTTTRPIISPDASAADGSTSGAVGGDNVPVGTEEPIFSVDARDLGDFALDPPTVESPSAIVIDEETGRVLYERDSAKRRPMASTTKIMTAVLILESMDLSTPVTVSQKAAETIEPKTWLRTGDVLTVEELMYALMIRSANSAAVALAEACSGSVEAFAARMNAKAAELGMEDTHFVNPNGLDAEGHYSTAADMAVLGRYAMQDPLFRKIVDTESYTVQLEGRSSPTVFTSTNKLLTTYDWVTGIKTGLTPRAEQCLVGAATKDGVSVISVLLGQPASDICWTESKAMLEYGLSQFKHLTLLDEGVAVAMASVPYKLDGRIQLVTDGPVEYTLYKDDEVTASVVVDKPLVLPVETGERYGRVVLTVAGDTVGTVDLIADGSFEKTTLGSKLTYYWDRFSRWVGRLF